MSLPKIEKQIDEETFTKLNEETAFLLGFIFADGFMGFHKNTGLNYLRIYSKFRYKIENIKEILKSKARINHVKEKFHGEIKQGELFYLHIGNEVIIEDLIDLGMVENKNYNIKFPYLPIELYPHFIRGAWSGKGSILINKKSIFSLFSIGSIEFITDLEKHLHQKGLTKQKIQQSKLSKKPSYKIKYSINDTKKLYDYIYSSVTKLTICKEHSEVLETYFSEYKPKPLKRKMNRKIKK